MTKTYNYEEGKQAQKEFEEGMKALLQFPKEAAKDKKKPAKKRAKKTSGRGVSRDPGEA